MNSLRIVNWNARSVLPKKAELETLVQVHQPHVVCITETWLRSDKNFFFFGYRVYRKDRIHGRGGGVAILVVNEIVTSEVEFMLTEPGDFYPSEYLGIRIHTPRGRLECFVVYSPSDSNPDIETWEEFLGGDTGGSSAFRIVCGDFNALFASWGSERTDQKGNKLATAIENCGYVSINDELPTHVPEFRQQTNNLDLAFVPLTLHPEITFEVGTDAYGSDHLPLIMDLSIRPITMQSFSHRLNVTKVDWLEFGNDLEIKLPIWVEGLGDCSSDLKYEELIDRTVELLTDHGAYRPIQKKGRRKTEKLSLFGGMKSVRNL